MAVSRLDADGFKNVVANGDLPVVVDFYADWCGPCHHLAPIIDALSKRYEGHVMFAKLNVDDEPELAATYQIRSIPAVILFEDGEPRGRSVGAKPAQALARELGLDRYGDGDVAATASAKKSGVVRDWWGRR